MRNVIWGLGFLSIALGIGCGQDLPSNDNATTSGALSAVQGCIADSRTCNAAGNAPAAGPTCGEKLRACLADRFGQGMNGVPGNAPPDFDAGIVPPASIPTSDAGLPPLGTGMPTGTGLPPTGTGVPPTGTGLPTGMGLPTGTGLPTGAPGQDGGAGQNIAGAIQACIATLKDCLTMSMSAPIDCAMAARDCIVTSLH